MLSQFVLSGVFICQRYSAGAQGARGAGGSRGQSRPCRHAAAGREAGTGGRHGGVVWDPADTRRWGPYGSPSRCNAPPRGPGGRGSARCSAHWGTSAVPRGTTRRPAHAHVSWAAPHNTPPPHGACVRGGCPVSLSIPGGDGGGGQTERAGGWNRPTGKATEGARRALGVRGGRAPCRALPRGRLSVGARRKGGGRRGVGGTPCRGLCTEGGAGAATAQPVCSLGASVVAAAAAPSPLHVAAGGVAEAGGCSVASGVAGAAESVAAAVVVAAAAVAAVVAAVLAGAVSVCSGARRRFMSVVTRTAFCGEEAGARGGSPVCGALGPPSGMAVGDWWGRRSWQTPRG